ncbi:MAG: hypothetical protein IJ220_04555 [Clostridia bacterium]|nr:hypothetical protein [Clostridia bacterium]
MNVKLITKIEIDNQDEIYNILRRYFPEMSVKIELRPKKPKTKKKNLKTYYDEDIKFKSRLRYEREPEFEKRKYSKSEIDYKYEQMNQEEEIQKIVNYYTGVRNSMMDY